MKHKVFVDMDGVLTDLHGAMLATRQLGEDVIRSLEERTISDQIFWKIVNDAGLKFWSEMKWTPNGRKLWNLIAPRKPTIISACKKDGIYAVQGKKLWIKNNIGEAECILCLREAKQMHAHPKAVLIDDREDNIAEWEKSGGIGILYHDAKFEAISVKIREYI